QIVVGIFEAGGVACSFGYGEIDDGIFVQASEISKVEVKPVLKKPQVRTIFLCSGDLGFDIGICQCSGLYDSCIAVPGLSGYVCLVDAIDAKVRGDLCYGSPEFREGDGGWHFNDVREEKAQ